MEKNITMYILMSILLLVFVSCTASDIFINGTYTGKSEDGLDVEFLLTRQAHDNMVFLEIKKLGDEKYGEDEDNSIYGYPTFLYNDGAGGVKIGMSNYLGGLSEVLDNGARIKSINSDVEFERE